MKRRYFTFFNFCALNFGAFYSTKYRRWYVQIIPMVLCMVVVVGRQPRRDCCGEFIGTGEFGGDP